MFSERIFYSFSFLEHPKYIELKKINTELLEKQKIETEKLAEANKKELFANQS